MLKSYLTFFIPRRIKLKNTILCIILFVLIILLIDDQLNNHDNYTPQQIEESELDDINKQLKSLFLGFIFERKKTLLKF